MNTLQISEDIFPLGSFKAQASRLLRELGKSHQAIIITQNGKPAGVLISPQEFDRLQERQRFIAAVEEGLQDAKAGRTIDDQDLDDILEKRFGKMK